MPLQVKLEVKNLQKVVDAFKQKTGWKKASAALAEALYAEGSEVMKLAKRMTPVDTGWLRNSAYLKRPDTGSAKPTIEAGYAAAYAEYVHDAPAGTNFQVGESKFLEKAVRRRQQRMLGMITRRMKRYIATGTVQVAKSDTPQKPKTRGKRPTQG